MRSQRRLCFIDAVSRLPLLGDDADRFCTAKKSKNSEESDSDQRVTLPQRPTSGLLPIPEHLFEGLPVLAVLGSG